METFTLEEAVGYIDEYLTEKDLFTDLYTDGKNLKRLSNAVKSDHISREGFRLAGASTISKVVINKKIKKLQDQRDSIENTTENTTKNKSKIEAIDKKIKALKKLKIASTVGQVAGLGAGVAGKGNEIRNLNKMAKDYNIPFKLAKAEAHIYHPGKPCAYTYKF